MLHHKRLLLSGGGKNADDVQVLRSRVYGIVSHKGFLLIVSGGGFFKVHNSFQCVFGLRRYLSDRVFSAGVADEAGLGHMHVRSCAVFGELVTCYGLFNTFHFDQSLVLSTV